MAISETSVTHESDEMTYDVVGGLV